MLTRVRITATKRIGPAFRARARTLERSMPEVMRRLGRLTAVSLATHAQPFGLGADAQNLGQDATVGDIRRVYAYASDVYPTFSDKRQGAAFWKSFQKKAFERANAIKAKFSKDFRDTPIDLFDGGRLHQEARNNRGRIPKKMTPRMIVINAPALKAYINKEFKLVGWGKAGWATCARAFGSVSGISGWITRHKAPGAIVENYGHGRAEITLINQVSYATAILSATEKAKALLIAEDRLLKAIQIEEKKAARAAGF